MNRHKSGQRTLSDDELSMLCSQLALLLQAGIGTEEGVSLLADDADGPQRATLEQLHARLLGGERLSQALAADRAFPPYLLRMVEIGQASGRLEQVLSALAVYYRRESDTRQNLRRAVAYPAVMALLIAVVFLVLVARVLPVFQLVFTQLGVGLSPVARVLLQFGSASQTAAAGFTVLLALGALLLFWLFRTQRGARLSVKWFSHTAAGRAVDRSRFSSALAMMLASGLPLDEAMGRTLTLLEGSALSGQLADCQRRMEGGASFPTAVEGAGLLSGLQAGLLSVGFRAGVADRTMEELARRSQEEADLRLDRMLGRFEYGLVIALCLAVGLVLLSVMLPLLGVLSAIGG